MALEAVVVAVLLCLAGTAGSCIPPPKSASVPRSAAAVVFPAAPSPRPVVDWRARGAVTAIKNQGPLDSCWAMAAVGAIEGLHKIRTGKLVSLSSQEVYDCSEKKFVHSYSKALDWVLRNGGVASEAEYPYTAQKQDCKREKLKKITSSIRGYVANINSEADLMVAVARQPVAVHMSLDERSFHEYIGGIFTGPCGNTHHAMLVVGYGAAADGTKYWIIKNSYGLNWG